MLAAMSEPFDHSGESSAEPAVSGEARDALRAYMRNEWPHKGRPPKYDVEKWAVTDDWPDRVPVTAAEVRVFEAWFGDLFDELFGPC